ncbi:dual OB domain-containing protein [Caulobacter sp. LjRoot300]|uniref:dual OB domain-containing protein n=1 Tax=Caulobacter sp. LjRoot300 TaxID=3342321 RepID=UPI003ECE7A53
MSFKVVVTEVTIYNRFQRCVAGFDLERGVMIRPEPKAGAFWEAKFCGPNTTFHPGHVLDFNGVRPETALPHNTEDIVVRGKVRELDKLEGEAFTQVLRRAEALSPEKVFGTDLKFDGGKAYVPPGAHCGSLSGLSIDAAQIRLVDQIYKEDHKLRAELTLDGHRLNLSVGAKDFRQAFDKQGLAGASALLPKRGLAHVRLGLARAWDVAPDRCYLQVNGIYALQ